MRSCSRCQPYALPKSEALSGTPATSNENPFIRPVLAMFARTVTPASSSRSMNCAVLGRSSANAASIASCKTMRAGRLPARIAASISAFFIERLPGIASFPAESRAGCFVAVRPWACSSSPMMRVLARFSFWPRYTVPSNPMRHATM